MIPLKYQTNKSQKLSAILWANSTSGWTAGTRGYQNQPLISAVPFDKYKNVIMCRRNQLREVAHTRSFSMREASSERKQETPSKLNVINFLATGQLSKNSTDNNNFLMMIKKTNSFCLKRYQKRNELEKMRSTASSQLNATSVRKESKSFQESLRRINSLDLPHWLRDQEGPRTPYYEIKEPNQEGPWTPSEESKVRSICRAKEDKGKKQPLLGDCSLSAPLQKLPVRRRSLLQKKKEKPEEFTLGGWESSKNTIQQNF